MCILGMFRPLSNVEKRVLQRLQNAPLEGRGNQLATVVWTST